MKLDDSRLKMLDVSDNQYSVLSCRLCKAVSGRGHREGGRDDGMVV